MPLPEDTRLGPYELVGPLGAGGMGEVYRARDSRLGRDVAVKVLPADLAHLPERLRRFEQEARAASALNHPNIVSIFDIGETDGVSWVAMELVEGETLQERLARGPLPLPKVLEIAAAVADGLAAAHQAGVVHRDLKPSNVMVANEGFVKVLDFGLAKLVQPADESRSHAATETSPGQLIGTAAYMSPEQAAGQPADARADQFALGLLIYEMVTGCAAFYEETVAETLTAILRQEPESVTELRPDVPTPLVWIIERCLAKDPRERYAATADLARDLRHLLTHLSDLSQPVGRALETTSRSRRGGRALPWIVAGALGVVAAMALMRPWADPGRLEPPAVTRLSIELPSGHEVATDYRPAVAVSPDGSRIVYSDRDGEGRRNLFARQLGDLETRLLPGTDDGSGPFFSPDGEWIGFFAYGKLKKMPAAGGPPITVADAPNSRGATWLPDDTIVFSPTFSTGLHRVRASGGAVETLSVPDPKAGEYSHRWPQWLPDGRTLIFGLWTRAPHLYERPAIALFDLETREHQMLIADGEFARYSPSGHLLYTRAGRLHTIEFDVETLETSGDPTSILDVALIDHNTFAAHYAISDEGTLAYVPGSLTSERTLVWVDQQGTETPIEAPPRAYLGARLSPDGRQIAVSIEGDTTDIWTYDLVNNQLRQLTFEGSNAFATWTPNGKHLTFSSDRVGGLEIFQIRSDGTGEPVQLTHEELIAVPGSWSHDGRYLAYSAYAREDLTGDLWILPVAEGGEPYRFLDLETDERWAQFSPDGKWLAYVSNAAAGLDQVYVAPFPGPGPIIQVSTRGGRDPLWSADGSEMYFRFGDQVLAVALDLASDEVATVGRSRLLFEGRYRRPPGALPNYDAAPDGHFLMLKGGEAPDELDHLHVVLGWWDGLTRR